MAEHASGYTYNELPIEQRELAEVMARIMADRLSSGRAAVMAEIEADVDALVALAVARQHLRPDLVARL